MMLFSYILVFSVGFAIGVWWEQVNKNDDIDSVTFD